MLAFEGEQARRSSADTANDNDHAGALCIYFFSLSLSLSLFKKFKIYFFSFFSSRHNNAENSYIIIFFR